MARWQTHRSDGNAARLRAFLEAHGAQVDVIDTPVDWAIGYRGVSALAEVKTARGILRPNQKAFLDGYKGLSAILRTEADCEALLAQMRLLGAVAKRIACPR